MKKLFLLSGLALFIPALAANAATKSLTLTNTVNVQNMCTLNTTQNMGFGAYNPLNEGDANRATGQVQLYCNPGTYTVRINNGVNSQETFVKKVEGFPTGAGTYYWQYDCQRRVKNSSNSTLAYSIYMDAGYSTPLGQLQTGGSGTPNNNGGFSCGSNSVNLKSITFTGSENSAQLINLYGLINANQGSTANTGTYTDSITLQINF